jgi:hypothetical protein
MLIYSLIRTWFGIFSNRLNLNNFSQIGIRKLGKGSPSKPSTTLKKQIRENSRSDI